MELREPNTEVGSVCYLKLDQLTPAWRQAVLVQVGRKRDRQVLAVRVTREELKARQLEAAFETQDAPFLLVEGKREQLRASCAGRHRALELEADDVLHHGQEALNAGDMQFVTASEDLEPPASAGRTSQAAAMCERSSGSEDESEEDGVLRLLMEAQRKNAGPSTGRDSREKRPGDKPEKRGRYAMLKGKQNTQPETTPLEKVLAQQPAGVDLNALVSLEILRTLKGKGVSKKRGSAVAESRSSSVSSSEESSSSKDKPRGAGKALRDYRREHAQMKKHPLRHVKRYVAEAEETLGICADTGYNLTDYTKKLHWGKNRSLMRVHYVGNRVLQTLLQDKPKLAALQLVQLLRALYQVNLDQGSWRAASLLMEHQDPLERPRFGGEPQQLEHIATYLKAMDDLEKRSSHSTWREPEEDTKAGRDPDGKGKSRKGKKQKEGEAKTE